MSKPTPLTVRQFLEEVVKIIRSHISEKECQIFLFGSHAKEIANESSDLDIGILGKNKIPFEILARIKAEVGALQTLRSADIVDLQATDENFKEEVLSYGKKI